MLSTTASARLRLGRPSNRSSLMRPRAHTRALVALLACASARSLIGENPAVALSVDATADRQPIHPEIYGVMFASAADLKAMLLAAGFSKVEVYGSLDGKPYDHEAQRLVVVATKGPGYWDGPMI